MITNTGRLPLLIVVFALLFFSSCTNETYESGDGTYSYLKAEFGEVTTAEAESVVSFTSDDGDEMHFSPAYSAKWAEKANTSYRALVYHDHVEQGTTQVLAMAEIPVVKPLVTLRPDTLLFDPVILNSAWVSKNGKYLNIGFAVKTGVADDKDLLQAIGIWREKEEKNADGTKDLYLRITHKQNGIPEFYRSEGFLSIKINETDAARIHLAVNTYDGEVTLVPNLQ